MAPSRAAKVSISLPGALLKRARKVAGPRGLSSLAAEALEREIKLRELDAYVEELREQLGPSEPALMEEVRAAWRRVSSSTPKR